MERSVKDQVVFAVIKSQLVLGKKIVLNTRRSIWLSNECLYIWAARPAHPARRELHEQREPVLMLLTS